MTDLSGDAEQSWSKILASLEEEKLVSNMLSGLLNLVNEISRKGLYPGPKL